MLQKSGIRGFFLPIKKEIIDDAGFSDNDNLAYLYHADDKEIILKKVPKNDLITYSAYSIRKSGNSLGLTFPARAIKYMEIDPNNVNFSFSGSDGKITISII